METASISLNGKNLFVGLVCSLIISSNFSVLLSLSRPLQFVICLLSSNNAELMSVVCCPLFHVHFCQPLLLSPISSWNYFFSLLLSEAISEACAGLPWWYKCTWEQGRKSHWRTLLSLILIKYHEPILEWNETWNCEWKLMMRYIQTGELRYQGCTILSDGGSN